MKHAGFAVVLLLAGAGGLARVHPFGDPRAEPRAGLGALAQDSGIPDAAKSLLVRKCGDCHSNETRWPVYARVAPGSWLIERDITKARAKMNLSRWDEISADGKEVLIARIIHEAKEGGMPPLQYRAVHWGSGLTVSDVVVLRSLRKAGFDEASSSVRGDAERGKLVFAKRCTGCHAMNGDREGPRLAGVFGRRAGSVSGFEYSAGLRNSGLRWDEATLERWLTDPDLIAPDTKMDFHVPKEQERKDLVAYLKQG